MGTDWVSDVRMRFKLNVGADSFGIGRVWYCQYAKTNGEITIYAEKKVLNMLGDLWVQYYASIQVH